MTEGGAKSWGGRKRPTPGRKRPLSGYNRFVQECARTPEGATRSGKDMLKYCAAQWKKKSAAEKAAYKR